MYGNLSNQSYLDELEANKLVINLSPGIYTQAKLTDIYYTNENIEKLTFVYKGENFEGSVDILAGRNQEDGEKITRGFAHILNAHGINIDSVLKRNFDSFQSLANAMIEALSNNQTLVDFKIVGYTYNNDTKYGQGFPLSGKSTKTGGWIANNFMSKSPGRIMFSDYEEKRIAAYNLLRKGGQGNVASNKDLDAAQLLNKNLAAKLDKARSDDYLPFS